jgi:hypothetical protein
MRPTFLIIGTMKGGTTSLYEYLRRHPQVFMANPKELHYFVEQRNLGKGKEWYEAHFAEAGGARAIGEASVTYTMRSCFPGVPERVRDLMPDVKLIYVLRHPIERMRSHYLHARWHRTESRRPDDALLGNLDYLHTSRYAYQIEPWLEHFDREQLLILTSDELRDDREATITRAFAFLDIDPTWRPAGLGNETHRTSDKRVARQPVAPLLTSDAWRRVLARLPARARRAHDRLLTVPADAERARISSRTEQLLLDGVRPDLVQLRGILGPDFHC